MYAICSYPCTYTNIHLVQSGAELQSPISADATKTHLRNQSGQGGISGQPQVGLIRVQHFVPSREHPGTCAVPVVPHSVPSPWVPQYSSIQFSQCPGLLGLFQSVLQRPGPAIPDEAPQVPQYTDQPSPAPAFQNNPLRPPAGNRTRAPAQPIRRCRHGVSVFSINL